MSEEEIHESNAKELFDVSMLTSKAQWECGTIASAGQGFYVNSDPVSLYVIAESNKGVWRGSPDELQAIIRDADRFRKLAAKHAEDSDSGAWCDVDLGDFDPIRLPLAEIADALPALTDSNRRNDG